MDPNTVKYYDSSNLLVTQNNLLTLCCCGTPAEVDRYWEAVPCDTSFVARGSTCLEPNVVGYEDRIYVPRTSRCIGSVVNVCECQTLAFTSNTEIPTGNITNIVTLRQTNVGTYTYNWTSTSLVLSKQGGNSYTFNFNNYFNLNQLVSAIADVGDGWSLILGNSSYGRYSPGFIVPKTATFQVTGSPININFDSRNSGLSLKWNGTEIDYIEWSGDLGDFADDIKLALDITFGSEVWNVAASSGSPIIGSWTGYYIDIQFENEAECGNIRPDMTVAKKGLINAYDVRMYYGDYENNFPYDLPNWYVPYTAETNGVDFLNHAFAGDRFPQFMITSNNANFRPQFSRNLQLASLYHSHGNAFKFCSREGVGQSNFNFFGNFPPVHNYNETCCPQRGGKYGPDQRFSTTSVSGYDHYMNSDHSIFRQPKPRSTFGNLDSTFIYNNQCYNISPWYYLYNKEGFNVETDSATRKKLYQISDCQFGANGFDCDEADHNTPNNCYIELFLPQFHPLVPWGPFGAYHSNIITQLHKAYDYPDSHIAQTYDSGNPLLARYGATYRPWGYIKTRGSWLATESIEFRVSVHRPVPYYIGETEFDDLDLYATFSNVDPMFRVTGNNGCGPVGFWVDNPSGYTVGEFVDALNQITIDVSGSASGVPVFKFALGSFDARNVNCKEIINVSSELFDEWYRDPDAGANEQFHSNGPIDDDWRFSGADIPIGPLNNASMYGHHPENLNYYLYNIYGSDLDTSYHANIGIPKVPFHSSTEANAAADIAEFQDGYLDAYLQLLASHDVNSFICATPPKCRRKTGLPKQVMEYELAGYEGYTNDELMNNPKYGGQQGNTYVFTDTPEMGPYNPQSSDMWFTNIQGSDKTVLKLQEANHGKNLSSLTVHVHSSGQIWVNAVVQEQFNNSFTVSGVVKTMPTGEYTLSNAISDLNNLQLTYNFGGPITFNPVTASSGIWHQVWFDDRTYTDLSNENPSYASGVGLVATDYNYSYREPLRDQGPFSIKGREVNLKTFVRNRCKYTVETAAPDEYKLESNLISNLRYYYEVEPELPPCLPPTATIVPKNTELDCFGDEIVQGNWLLSYGCTSYVCNTEWFMKAERCGCSSVYDCTARVYDPHPVNQAGNSNNNISLYGNVFTVTQPTLYVCAENFHEECDIKMLIKVPFMIYKPSTKEVIDYIDSGYVGSVDGVTVDLTFCDSPGGYPGDQSDIFGWCQWINPQNAVMVMKEQIPANWPPVSYVMPRGYPTFCSVNAWSFDPGGVFCSDGCQNSSFSGRCPSCSNYDRMIGLIPWVDQNDPDAVVPTETYTALFRAAVNPTYNEMCNNGDSCAENEVSCGTKCCGCNFICGGSCDTLIHDKTITRTEIERMVSVTEPYQCQLEVAVPGGIGSCAGVYGVFGLICDTLTVGTYNIIQTTNYFRDDWNCNNRLGVAGGGQSCDSQGSTKIYDVFASEVDCPDEREVGVSGCGYVNPYCGVDPGFAICPGRGTCPDGSSSIGWNCVNEPPVHSRTCDNDSSVTQSVFTNCCQGGDGIGQHSPCSSGNGNDCSVNGLETRTEDYVNMLDSCGIGSCSWSDVSIVAYEGCMTKPCGAGGNLNGLCATGDPCGFGEVQGNLAGWQGTMTINNDAGSKSISQQYDGCPYQGTPSATAYTLVTGWFERIGYTLLGGNAWVSTDTGDFGDAC